MSCPFLEAPDYDRPFIVQWDASDNGMGVVLYQQDEEGNEHPIVYMSRKLSASEKGCALVWVAHKLACYLAGSCFCFESITLL